MKYPFCLYLFLLSSLAQAQNPDEKRDHVWMFGYEGGGFEAPYHGEATMDFNEDPPAFQLTNKPNFLSETNSSICDADGNLLFYTNGIHVFNASHQVMANGTGLSPCEWAETYAEFGMPMPGGAVILPLPNNGHLYAIVHGTLDVLPGTLICMTKLLYSIVDMDKLNGQGMVVEKNVELLSDTLSVGNISAVRHGNGRDWWVTVPKHDSNRYFRTLLTPEGFRPVEHQDIGSPVQEGLGQAVFSPDGTKYARNELINASTPDRFSFYRFDRCTGLLGEMQQVIYNYDGLTYSGGLAFAPSSRYMYVPLSGKIFQFDTDAPDLLSTMDTVALWDTFFAPFSTQFYLASLAPDGKIYVNCNNGVSVLHVIERPDLKGDSCLVLQNSIDLPSHNGTLPTYPNFRLGKWEGSPCDTIVALSATVPTYPLSQVLAYPNPASGEFYLYVGSPNGAVELVLTGAAGQVARTWPVPPGQQEHRFPLGGLAPGLYYWQLVQEGRAVGSGKVVVVE